MGTALGFSQIHDFAGPLTRVVLGIRVFRVLLPRELRGVIGRGGFGVMGPAEGAVGCLKSNGLGSLRLDTSQGLALNIFIFIQKQL